MNEENTYDCAIIGGGLSGIAAAIRLSHFGIKTVLLEKNANLGGLNTFYYKNKIEIDSGLHAMTNFSQKGGSKHLPLHKLLRQLRINYDELKLIEHLQSEVRFPQKSIVFDNDFSKTKESFKKNFPQSADGLDKLCEFISKYDAFSLDQASTGNSALKKISEFINDETLTGMILLPLMYYGNSEENDMDLSQFIIMFRSVFMEGFCRPSDGIRCVINLLENKLKENSCEIRRRAAVSKIVHDGKLLKIVLSDGTSLNTVKIISCAGANETLRLCDPTPSITNPDGRMAFVEAIFCMKDKFDTGEYKNACLFFNDKTKLNYVSPKEAFNIESGVLCCPHNFKYLESEKPERKFLRLTARANSQSWINVSEEKYSKLKDEFREAAFAKIADLSGLKISNDDVSFGDIFTPRTIQKWSGHSNGAIYGSPHKIKNGETEIKNLFICGTDQGFLGITGSILSGISIANKYALNT
ncbi:MAG TPA: FAD-dependent oxidoreductase [Victivallales bacterium]|mgnify:CR=1 FL=1|nr:FAD-dependent oxidoreductase [Victivallales bacterium]